MRHFHVIVIEPYILGGDEIRSHTRFGHFDDALHRHDALKELYPKREVRMLACNDMSCRWGI